jgi:hypothetical protein
MDHAIRLLFVLYFLLAEALLLALVWRWVSTSAPAQPGSHSEGARRPMRLMGMLALLLVQPLVPLGWLGLGWLLATLSEAHQADVIAVAHLGFMAGVLLFPVVVLLGGCLRWNWVRVFWPRLLHLLAVLLVVMQPSVGHECPINEFERTLRDGDLRNHEGASAIGIWANNTVYTRKPLEQLLPVYLTFLVLVTLSWLLVRPDVPDLSEGPRPS